MPLSPLEQTLQTYLDAGLEPHWLRVGQKRPVGKGWQRHPKRTLSELVGEYVEGYNLGIRAGRWSQPTSDTQLWVVDVDLKSADPAHQQLAEETLHSLLGDDLSIYPTVLSGRGNGSRHLYVGAPYDRKLIRARTILTKCAETVDVVRNGKVSQEPAFVIELLAEGAQVVAPPSKHPETGAKYKWHLPLSIGIPKLSDDALSIVADRDTLQNFGGATDPQPLTDINTVREALSYIDPDESYDVWISVGMALHSTDAEEEAFALWDEWSRRGEKYTEGEMREKWESFGGKAARITLGSLYYNAGARGFDGKRHRLDVIEDFDDGFQPENPDGPVEPARELDLTAGSDFSGRAITPRRWIIEGWLPLGHTVSLYGDGGSGKTLLSLQIATHVATGTPWCGMDVQKGKVLMLACEDDMDEIHRRLDAQLNHRFMNYDQLDDLLIHCGVGKDNLFITYKGDYGRAEMTDRFRSFIRTIEHEKPSLVVIDTLADVFGGSEINRSHVRQFVSALNGLALDHECTVLLLAHPSVAGQASKGASGSTAWSNSVRTRLYLSLDPEDTNHRVLSKQKANYSSIGDEIHLYWRAGVMEHVDPSHVTKQETQTQLDCKADFKDLMAKTFAAGEKLSAMARGQHYAPRKLHDMARAAGKLWTEQDFEVAMNRLMHDGEIESVVTRKETTSNRERTELRFKYDDTFLN